MDLLRVEHDDFTLFVECQKFADVFDRAKENIQPESLTSQYCWSEGVRRVVLDEMSLSQKEIAPAVFFDNTDYSVWVDFNIPVKKAQYLSSRQDDCEHFSFRKNILSGFLNFGNDIGLAEIRIDYEMPSGEKRSFVFGFEVLSTKLDYHQHWKSIIRDIEEEYRMLSLDFLKRTCQSFSEGSGETFDLIWWNVFQGIQSEFIQAAKNIIERPRHRLRSYQVYQRADKIRRFSPQLEQEFAEHRTEPNRLYVVQEQENSNNTLENRFLKHTLAFVAKKFAGIMKQLERLNQLSDVQKAEFRGQENKLTHLMRNPFFRTVGKFEGLRQESLVLQNDSNYSKIYRTSILLHKSFSLNEGMYRMQTKDIATLYEIWCFIQVSHIVKELMGDSVTVSHKNRMELNGSFVYELGRGEHSRILFEKDDVQLAELIYNPKNDDKVFVSDDSLSVQDLVSPTVPQKPDIVLQLTKDDLSKGMKLTYLFDAKYRISRRENGVDTPPDDAINQMHRYRDAIYYKQNDSHLKKEVIGGYILFPGKGEKSKIELSRYYESIGKVNIGAFPLRPDGEDSKSLLHDFIGRLLKNEASEIVGKVIPQKGLHYVPDTEKLLVAPCTSLDKYDWCAENEKYPIPLQKAHEKTEVFQVRHLLLHCGNDMAQLLHIKLGKVEIKSCQDMRDLNYPEPSHDFYLVLNLNKSYKYDNYDLCSYLISLGSKLKSGILIENWIW